MGGCSMGKTLWAGGTAGAKPHKQNLPVTVNSKGAPV